MEELKTFELNSESVALIAESLKERIELCEARNGVKNSVKIMKLKTLLNYLKSL